MDKLKEIIKEKDFVINSLILKNIKNFNLSVNEFLLLLYFINISNELDLNKINKYISLTEEEVINSYECLSKKGMIEIIVKKNGKVIEEEISLESFYNKLIINIPDKKKESDIYSSFEGEFGRTLSPIEYETITKWLDSGIKEEMILSALKEAVINGVSNLRYIDKIIYEWSKKEFKANTNNSKDVKVFDYNWLEDNSES